jgi:SAM-dependent methyltransferase
MTRDETVRYFLRREDLGLEIGAGFNPVVPKADGWNVETVDHLSREALVEKFRPHGVDVSKIEPVDHVWRGEPLDDLVGPHKCGRYRYVVASHVIEHIPDLIGFLTAVGRLLGPGGVLSLAIPDKRHCFDFFRPLTSTGELLEAHAAGRKRHTLRVAFDAVAYATVRSGSIAWDASQSGDLTLARDFSKAAAVVDAFEEDGADYHDFHHWTFVPSSFALAITELRALGLLELDVARTFPGAGCEFYVALQKTAEPPLAGDELQARRFALLRAAAQESTQIANF